MCVSPQSPFEHALPPYTKGYQGKPVPAQVTQSLHPTEMVTVFCRVWISASSDPVRERRNILNLSESTGPVPSFHWFPAKVGMARERDTRRVTKFVFIEVGTREKSWTFFD